MMIDASVLLYDLKATFKCTVQLHGGNACVQKVKSPTVAEIKQLFTSRVRKDGTTRKLFPKSLALFHDFSHNFFFCARFEVNVPHSEYYVQKN